jgi:CHAD domain-containing protein
MAISGTHDYFKVQAKIAMQELEKYFHDPQVETLHQFRVEIKKIRAVFFHLEEMPVQKSFKKIHRQIKKIFRKAGEIRELQLEMAWLEKHRKFNLLRLMQYESQLRKSDKYFHKRIPNMLDTFKKACRKTAHKLSTLTQLQTDQYISKKWQAVLLPLLKNIDEKFWHETRKGVKQLVYARHWINADTILQKKVISIFISLDKLQNAIGKWHDLDLLATKIQHLRKNMEGHTILQREQQLAMKKLLTEKEGIAKRIRNNLSKTQDLIRKYKLSWRSIFLRTKQPNSSSIHSHSVAVY